MQKGYPLADYALCCYGAAGAQHACLLAERLGMRRILLHPLAGVLSAYGIGLADFRVLKQAAVERLWQETDADELHRRFAELEQAARRELAEQGLDRLPISSRWSLALRYQGSDTALTLAYADPAALPERFASAYRRQFGFCYQRPVVIASLQVESVACDAQPPDMAPAPQVAVAASRNAGRVCSAAAAGSMRRYTAGNNWASAKLCPVRPSCWSRLRQSWSNPAGRPVCKATAICC
ncbi:hydantoinase/oxoprolinase family protein [Methylomonas koyamae]|uniref:hydantoinase/oxoprolinase family protein n=1 Tax=Methylomonas koyamae TaxID=702114 RepID=UPI000A4B0B66|nr:hydantoinase/oxoprolinase family protein [Methylomonas koyamae]